MDVKYNVMFLKKGDGDVLPFLPLNNIYIIHIYSRNTHVQTQSQSLSLSLSLSLTHTHTCERPACQSRSRRQSRVPPPPPFRACSCTKSLSLSLSLCLQLHFYPSINAFPIHTLLSTSEQKRVPGVLFWHNNIASELH